MGTKDLYEKYMRELEYEKTKEGTNAKDLLLLEMYEVVMISSSPRDASCVRYHPLRSAQYQKAVGLPIEEENLLEATPSLSTPYPWRRLPELKPSTCTPAVSGHSSASLPESQALPLTLLLVVLALAILVAYYVIRRFRASPKPLVSRGRLIRNKAVTYVTRA